MNFLSKARKELSTIKEKKSFKELVEGKELEEVSLYMFICKMEYKIEISDYFTNELEDFDQLFCIRAFSRIIQKIQKENPNEEEIILKLEIFSDTLQELNQKKKRNGEKGEGDENKNEEDEAAEDESGDKKSENEEINEIVEEFSKKHLKWFVTQILTIKNERENQRRDTQKSEFKKEESESEAETNEKIGVQPRKSQLNAPTRADLTRNRSNSKIEEKPPTDLTGIIDLLKKEVESVKKEVIGAKRLFDDGEVNKVKRFEEKFDKFVSESEERVKRESQPILNFLNTLSSPTVIAGAILDEVRNFHSGATEIVTYSGFGIVLIVLIAELIKANGGCKESCGKIFKYLKEFCSSCCCFSCCKGINIKECCGKLCEGFKNWWNGSSSEEKSTSIEFKERNTIKEQEEYSVDDRIVNSPKIEQPLVKNTK